MPSMLVGNIQAAVVGAATYNLIPPAGEAYCIVEVSSDVVFVGNQPDLSLALADGIHAACVIVPDPTVVAAQKGLRQKEIYITHTYYLSIINTAVGNANVGWTGYRVNANNVITYIATVPGGATLDVQPPDGQVWRITEIGAETYGAALHPDMTFRITDGVLVASMIMQETEDLRQQKLLNWYIDHDTFLQILDTSAADNDVAIIGVIEDVESFCGIVDCVGSAFIDIQPADGQEAVVTEISAEAWNGAVAGADDGPDATLSLCDGVNLSDLGESYDGAASPESLLWNKTLALHIDNALFLRITDTSTAANEIGWLGYIKREYTP